MSWGGRALLRWVPAPIAISKVDRSSPFELLQLFRAFQQLDYQFLKGSQPLNASSISPIVAAKSGGSSSKKESSSDLT